MAQHVQATKATMPANGDTAHGSRCAGLEAFRFSRLSGVSSAGRQILNELNTAIETTDGESVEDADGTQRIEADPRKRRGTTGPTGASTPGETGVDSGAAMGEDPTGN